MAIYQLMATAGGSDTLIWSTSASAFFNNVCPRISGAAMSGNRLYIKGDIYYGSTVTIEHIKYRNSSGSIVTATTNQTVTTYTDASGMGLVPLPSGCDAYNLLMQNPANPYFEIKLKNKSLGLASYIPLNVTYHAPIINSVTLTRDHANTTYNLNVVNTYWESYSIEVVQLDYDGNGNNKTTYNYTSSVALSSIKYTYLHEGNNQINITVYNGDKTATYSKAFSHYVSKISNLVLNSTNGLIEETVLATWDASNQGSGYIYINNVLAGTLGVGKTFIISPGHFIVGSNIVKVVIYNPGDAGVVNSSVEASISKTIKLDRVYPSISDITLSDTNTDNPIVISWTASDQNKCRIYIDNVLLYAGGTEQTVGVNPGVIPVKTKEIKVEVVKVTSFDEVVVSTIAEVTLKENTPIIYNVEPSNLTKNIDEPLNVTFSTNEFCDRWELVANGQYKSSGASDRVVVYGAGVFNKGINTLMLTTYYSPAYNSNIVRTATKTVTFTGYGYPQAPVIDKKDFYTGATPKIIWTADQEQTGYEYQLYKDDVLIDSGSEITTDNFVVMPTLDDLTEYVVKIRIVNQYGLYSSYSTYSFRTTFNDIILPDFYLLEGYNCVNITISGIQDSNFKSLSVFRRDALNDWLEIAYECNSEDKVVDYTSPCNKEVEYKIRVYDQNGAYKDSDSKTIMVHIINYWITNIENAEESYRLDFVESGYSFERNVVYRMYSKQSRVRVFKDNTRYNVISLDVTLENDKAFEFVKFIETANDYNIFCYRTWKGEKVFVSAVLNSMQPLNALLMEVSLTLTEVNFREEKMYKGSGYRKIVYLNGEYMLDGTIDLTGYDNTVVTTI